MKTIAFKPLIILLLLKNNVRALFYGKSAAVPIDFKEFEEDINKIFNAIEEQVRFVKAKFKKLGSKVKL